MIEITEAEYAKLLADVSETPWLSHLRKMWHDEQGPHEPGASGIVGEPSVEQLAQWASVMLEGRLRTIGDREGVDINRLGFEDLLAIARRMIAERYPAEVFPDIGVAGDPGPQFVRAFARFLDWIPKVPAGTAWVSCAERMPTARVSVQMAMVGGGCKVGKWMKVVGVWKEADFLMPHPREAVSHWAPLLQHPADHAATPAVAKPNVRWFTNDDGILWRVTDGRVQAMVDGDGWGESYFRTVESLPGAREITEPLDPPAPSQASDAQTWHEGPDGKPVAGVPDFGPMPQTDAGAGGGDFLCASCGNALRAGDGGDEHPACTSDLYCRRCGSRGWRKAAARDAWLVGCPECDGKGSVDYGRKTPSGQSVYATCPKCEGHGVAANNGAAR